MDKDNISWIALLPLLIQSKIARQYLSAIFKSKHLGVLTESVFSPKLLEHRTSWLNSSHEFFVFLNLLRRIKSGFYFYRRHGKYCDCSKTYGCSDNNLWIFYGFYVTVDENSLKFQHVDLHLLNRNSPWKKNTKIMDPVKKSLSSAAEFVKMFASEYQRYDNVDSLLCCSCPSENSNFFLVNRVAGIVLWTDKRLYNLKNLLYFPKDRSGIYSYFDLPNMKIHKYYGGNEWGGGSENIEAPKNVSAKNLVEFLMSDDGKLIPDVSRFEFEMRLSERNEEVLVTVSVRDSFLITETDTTLLYDVTKTFLGKPSCYN